MKQQASNTSKWKQGVFVPRNPNKYRGDPSKIIFRSSWEQDFAKFLDGNVHVLQWASEEFAIEYFNPIKKRPAKYFPDFWVQYEDLSGKVHVEVIEIKPANQVYRPKGGNVSEMATWVQNTAKWNAAIKFCRDNHLKFRVLTERVLYSR